MKNYDTAAAVACLGEAFLDILKDGPKALSCLEREALRLGHMTIASAVALALEAHDLELCADLPEGARIRERRTRTLATTFGEKEAHGGITRAGAPHLRRGLVEGCCGLDRWGTGEKVVKGHPASPNVIAIANKANARLRKRYRYLRDERGKTPNKAKVAVVNELVRWIWVIGCAVEAEQAA